MIDDTSPLPPPVDPLMVSQWAGLIRTLIAVLAGAGILGGVWSSVSAAQIANTLTAFLTVGGALMAAGSAFWSWRQKLAQAKAQRKAEVAAAVASAALSANAGRPIPVTVTETPPGQENVATKVSVADAAKAVPVPVDVEPRPAPVVATVPVS